MGFLGFGKSKCEGCTSTSSTGSTRSRDYGKFCVKVLSDSWVVGTLGLGLSFGKTKTILDDYEGKIEFNAYLSALSEEQRDKIGELVSVGEKLSTRDLGHNKFLEQCPVALYICAPRYWWSEFDTYRSGVSKSSESTMHTLMRRELTRKDFVPGVHDSVIEAVNTCIREKDFFGAKKNLPEGFLQRRVVALNYKVLRTIILQRHDHRLPEWQAFIIEVMRRIANPALLGVDAVLKKEAKKTEPTQEEKRG